jgi:uncharacterized protein (TIGR02246 family)
MTLNPEDLKQMAASYSKAWSSGSPEAVASHYAHDGQISINRGDTIIGRAAIAEMAAGFYAEFPDLVVHCDDVRTAGDHAIFVWTLEGHHAETKNLVKVGGWEEWELDENMKVNSSLGWFDANEYERQIAEGV